MASCLFVILGIGVYKCFRYHVMSPSFFILLIYEFQYKLPDYEVAGVMFYNCTVIFFYARVHILSCMRVTVCMFQFSCNYCTHIRRRLVINVFRD